jgi:Bacterial Ig-like domain (group 3)
MTFHRQILSLAGCNPAGKPLSTWLSSLLLVLATLPAAYGQQTKQVEHPGARGFSAHPAVRVPFKPGPFGPDGKVQPVIPDKNARRFPPETETPEERAAELRAAAGMSIPSGKPFAHEITAQELSLLNWNPTKLNPIENPLVGTELFKGPERKNPLQMPKGRKTSNGKVIAGTDFAGSGDTTWFPPDGGIAAGPIQIVEVINSSINVYDKNGILLSSQTLNNFFSGLGTPGSDFLYDPSAYYDQESGVFWVLATSENNSPNRSNQLVAVSVNSDVTNGWYTYYLDATVNGSSSTNNWCDYPHMGVDADAIYISCNQFSFPSTNSSFQYGKVRTVDKDEFINDACCTWWDFWNLAQTTRPALERWVGHGVGDFWVAADGSGGSGDFLHVYQLQNPTACCDGSGGPTLVEHDQNVGSYDSAPSGAQPNSIQGVDTGGTRIQYAIYQFGHLSVGQTIACNPGGTNHACVAYTDIDVSSYPTMTNVNDWVFGVTGEDLYYPFVDQNVNSDKTMVYSRSDSSSTYPGAYYRGIVNPYGSCVGCIDGEGTMKTGSANYLVLDGSNRNRWGDYQGASNDTDFLGIWVEGEYVASSNSWAKDIEATYNSYYPIDSPTPTSVPFGNVAVFANAATQYVTFTNTGNATMYTNLAYISGNSAFFITYDGCSFITLQPGAGCLEGVSFHPTAIGAISGLVVLLDNSPASFADSSLTGTGVKAGTTATLGSSLNPSTYGQSVTFTAHVSSTTTGTPGGSFTFKDGATSLGTAPLSGGVAQLTTSALGGGAHTISATYSGSPLYLTSVATLGQTVNKAPSTSKVVSSLNPSTYGNDVTFTATVTSGAGTPGGTVTFKDGATSLGTSTLASGTAKLTTKALGGGTHSITAVYSSSPNFAASTSPAITQTVKKAGSTSVVTASVNPSSWHESVTFTAKVTSPGGTPAGTVTFKNGTTTIGTGTLNGSGVATFATNALTIAAHSITVVYAGNANFATSTSAALTQTVTKAKSTNTLTSSKNPSTHGTAVTFTATIAGAFGGTATGTVTFKNGTATMGTGTLNANNKVTFTTSTLAVGTHSITAVYPGDTHFTSSTSAAVKQVVQ